MARTLLATSPVLTLDRDDFDYLACHDEGKNVWCCKHISTFWEDIEEGDKFRFFVYGENPRCKCYRVRKLDVVAVSASMRAIERGDTFFKWERPLSMASPLYKFFNDTMKTHGKSSLYVIVRKENPSADRA